MNKRVGFSWSPDHRGELTPTMYVKREINLLICRYEEVFDGKLAIAIASTCEQHALFECQIKKKKWRHLLRSAVIYLHFTFIPCFPVLVC